jgi:hypothetical protein
MQYSLNKERFQTILADSKITRQDKLLLILFWDEESSKSLSTIKEIAVENGLRECLKWNISDILSKAKGKVTSIKGNWILTIPGRTHLISKNFLSDKKSNIVNDVKDLHTHLSSISNIQTKSFLEEAINCLESDQRRAAVVFSWVGAIAVLYDEVIRNHLIAFNIEASKKDSKWKPAKNSDDLGKMKEFDFLNTLEAISVIGKNVKQELQQCLQLRNGCGHPNSLKIGFRRVAAHIEILILNVFSKF